MDITNIKGEECSACNNKHIDVRTEVIIPPLGCKPGHIQKAIFFRCKDHINCSTDEMECLALLKSINVKHEDLHFDTCASPHDSDGSPQKGVTVTHRASNTVVSYTEEKYQSFNKIRAVQKLKSKLNS